MISSRYYNLSKRSKVVSDKPAYKKKEKTDSGYVYRYDEKHIEKRWKEKKEKLKRLEKEIKKVRDQYHKDLDSDDERTRAIAAIVGIMDNTAMRVGNEESAEEGTFGASTLKVKHVKMSGGKMKFDFPGKGSIEQHIELDDKKVIKAIKDLMKGKKGDDFIFEVDDKKIWDRAVNRYLQDFDISAKDIRGFHSNRLMKEMLKKKDNFKEALDEVAEIVGHEPATLKNQYLDPELVEKNIKKAFTLYAEAPMSQTPTLLPDPNVQKEIMSADTNANVGNVQDPSLTKFPNLYRAWRILAPFLPYGAYVSSAFRGPGKQTKIILDYWYSGIWPRGSMKFTRGRGFFHTNFGRLHGIPETFVPSIRSKYHKNLSPEEQQMVEKIRTIMITYKPQKGSRNGPRAALDLAAAGSSAHERGWAFDVSGAPINEIVQAVQTVNMLFNNIFDMTLGEESQDNVHLTVKAPVSMPDQNFFAESLHKYKSKQPFARMQMAPAHILSKRALLPKDEKWLSKLEHKYFRQPSISTKDRQTSEIKVAPANNTLGILPGVKVNDMILAAWMSLKPFLPTGAVMTSGHRTPEDQTRIINNYWTRSGLEQRYPHITDPYERSRLLISNGWSVEAPSKSPHLRGNSFDISGADLQEIAEAARKVSTDPNLPVDFSQVLVEDKNNAVHVGISNAKYDEQAVARVKSQGLAGVAASDVNTIFEDLVKSGAPQYIIDEYEEMFFKTAEDEEMLNNSRSALTPAQIQEDMGLGKDDEPGDYFEKDPVFRNREDTPEYNIHEISEGEAQALATNDPEKFFYRGLHREYPKLEPQALANILKTNAKFYFIFKYHERKEPEFEKLLQSAAEALSQQDVRAFFYYYLHKKFPELGRGAIVQLIDTNPDSFFDLGLDADYPDYKESASNARNIKDPNKVELEMPEWLEPQSNKPLSLRDRNASNPFEDWADIDKDDEEVRIVPLRLEPSMRKRRDFSERETEYIAHSDPEKFFSERLNEQHPQFERRALKEMLKINPRFYFIFRYDRKEEFADLLPDAALALLENDPKSFFNYGLDKTFPELAKEIIPVKTASGLGPVAPMRLRKLEDPKTLLDEYDASELWVQQKIDGIKTMAIKDSKGSIKIYSRRGEDFTSNVDPLIKDLDKKMDNGDFILGELAWLKNGKQSIGDIQTILNSTPENAKKKFEEKGELVFYVYDLLYNNSKDISKNSYKERYEKLTKQIGKGTEHIEVIKNYSWNELDKAVDDAIKIGGEGAVIKYNKGQYKYAPKGSNEPHGEQWKYKPKGRTAKTDEVIVKDYHKGKEKLIFPAFQYKGGELFEVGQVSGLPKEEEQKVKKQIDDGKIVILEVSYQDKTDAGKFRHMGYGSIRVDKPQKEVKWSKASLSIRH